MCFVSWDAHLASVCACQPPEFYSARHERILGHISKYHYPQLTPQERHAIRVIAESLYENIKSESEKSLSMYRKLDEAFVQSGELVSGLADAV